MQAKTKVVASTLLISLVLIGIIYALNFQRIDVSVSPQPTPSSTIDVKTTPIPTESSTISDEIAVSVSFYSKKSDTFLLSTDNQHIYIHIQYLTRPHAAYNITFEGKDLCWDATNPYYYYDFPNDWCIAGSEQVNSNEVIITLTPRYLQNALPILTNNQPHWNERQSYNITLTTEKKTYSCIATPEVFKSEGQLGIDSCNFIQGSSTYFQFYASNNSPNGNVSLKGVIIRGLSDNLHGETYYCYRFIEPQQTAYLKCYCPTPISGQSYSVEWIDQENNTLFSKLITG
jgi:hypothetical protein